jgi:hypothetical protein
MVSNSQQVQSFPTKENWQRHFVHLENQPGGKQYCLHYLQSIGCPYKVVVSMSIVELPLGLHMWSSSTQPTASGKECQFPRRTIELS